MPISCSGTDRAALEEAREEETGPVTVGIRHDDLRRRNRAMVVVLALGGLMISGAVGSRATKFLGRPLQYSLVIAC